MISFYLFHLRDGDILESALKFLTSFSADNFWKLSLVIPKMTSILLLSKHIIKFRLDFTTLRSFPALHNNKGYNDYK